MQTITKPLYHFDQERHIHFLGDRPLIGTTTCLDVLGKVLTWYASGKACEQFGWLKSLEKDRTATKEEKNQREIERYQSALMTLNKIMTLTVPEYQELLDRAYCAHNEYKKQRAAEGTDLHAEIELYIKARIAGKPVKVVGVIEPFAKWADENVKEFLASEVHCYSENQWVGGICDLIYLDKDDSLVIGDIKSAKAAYFNHFVQIAGYSIQLVENGGYTPSGQKVFDLPQTPDYYAVFALGAKNWYEPTTCKNIGMLNKSFLHTLNLYKLKMEYEREFPSGY